MKRWFSALPIHRKLTALAFGVSGAALIAAVLALVLFDLARYRTTAVSDTQAIAQVLAENIAAALVFDDPEAGRATLSSVGVRPTVLRACAYRSDGSLLAAFARDSAASCGTTGQHGSAWLSVVTRVPVVRNEREVGSILVERDLSDLGGRVLATLSTGGLMLLAGGLTALGLAGLLQRLISRPIVALAQAARRVGHEADYRLPSIEAPADETGELVRAFGDMVQRISDTNAALMESNAALRQEVEQRRQMQVEREALLTREREASRLKDEFLAAVSHELRTPLNAIMGWTQILKSTSPNEQTMQRAIASLARNAEAQSRVIEDLLDISRIITGKLQLAMKEVDLRAVIETAADVIEPMSRSRGVAIQLSLPTVPCIVQGDYDRLRQILWNLLSNALKFTPSGGRVEVQLELAAESFTIVVRDTGVGMDPAFLSHAFERFRQADGTTTREQGGLGLGLAIVKELTELHGGTVRAESAGLGQGATFRVTIPRAPVTRLGEAHAAPPNQQLPSLRGLRVMVVDDNADALEVLGHALERAGAEVRLERSADAAVAEWPAWPTDVLLCDLAMPGLDGFELLRRIRAIDAAAGRSTPALAVTAYASEDYRIRCLRAGFAGHVAKPYNIADIVRAVAAAAAPN